MGLDISFFCTKRPAYDKYQKDLEEWMANEPEFLTEETKTEPARQKTYEEMTEEEHKRYSDWLSARPDWDEIATDCGYFRKVNFLLPFFGYTENCEDKEISRGELEGLVEACAKILAAYDQREREDDDDYEGDRWEDLADCYLPTESGFFFGSTDYDEWYISDVRKAKEWAEKLLADLNEKDIVIMNYWW